MPRNAGPTGGGLLPPSVDRQDDEERDDLPEGVEDEELEIDGVPPVEDEDDDDDDPDGDREPARGGRGTDLDELERRLTQQFQRKFDAAVSKAARNIERRYQDRQPPVEEREPEERRPRESVRSSDRSDVTTIRLLARDLIAEEMEGQGRQEKTAARQVIDGILPYVDWSQVDDQDEFVEGLVTRLKGVTSELVKAGSDRKVAQLRKAGVLQERQGQPGAGSGQPRRSQTADQLRKGADIASRRFPQGTRRLGGR